MSVLANLNISYESLPGEPSYFTSALHTMASDQELTQSFFSAQTLTDTVVPKRVAHSNDVSSVVLPSLARKIPARTASKIRRSNNHTSLEFTNASKRDLTKQNVSKPQEPQQNVHAISTALSNNRSGIKQARGIFNDFERASLLSYMQTRTTSRF